MLVDTANVAFVIHATYFIGVTNFRASQFVPWSLPAIALSGFILEVSVEQFYAYRIYRLRRGSPYLPTAISAVSLTSFGIGTFYYAKIVEYLHAPSSNFLGFCIAALSCKIICDLLITVGMVYTLSSNRTQVRRANTVLNLLATYAINCGTLNLVFAISCLTLLTTSRSTFLYPPSFFIMVRLYFCAFMSILNSRDNLSETLDRPDGIVNTFTQLSLRVRAGTTVPCAVQVTTETSTNAAIPKNLPPKVSSDSVASFTDSVLAFDREKYPKPPVPGVFTA
ncbi:hypothetical protein V8E53_003638 [Lactarius tabidus]